MTAVRIARVSVEGSPRFGVVEGEGDLRSVSLLSAHPFGELVFTGERVPFRNPLAPVLPSKIIGIGKNYADHAAEMGGEAPTAPLMFFLNFLFNIVEYVSKPLSHSLRLFGNMYAGEIIFLLLWMWAATGVVGTLAGTGLGFAWAIFHVLIVALQAYIFMMLTVVYIAMAHEHH